MKQIKYFLLLSLGLFGFLFVSAISSSAQTCASTRIINQFACIDTPGSCTSYNHRCSNDLNVACPPDSGINCGPGQGSCIAICSNVSGDVFTCGTTGSQTVSCSDAANGCSASANVRQCGFDSSGSCLETQADKTYQCYVNSCNNNGVCDAGEGSSCADCTSSGGGGGGGSCGTCSDYCAGANQCFSQGGTQVGSTCAGWNCAPNTGPCLICGGGGGNVSSCNASITGPSVIALGGSGNYHAYGAGTPDDWYTTWTPTWSGTFSPPASGYQNWWSNGSGPNSNIVYTPNAGSVGTHTLRWDVHPGDWTHGGEIACTTTKTISVIPAPPGCALTMPASITIQAGSPSRKVSPAITPAVSASVNNVTYSSLNSGIASVTSPGVSPGFSTQLAGVAIGNTSFTTVVNMDDGTTCTTTPTTVTVTAPGPWWQAGGNDVITNQSLVSMLQGGASTKFLLDGASGFPGNALFGGTTNLTNANTSSKGWLGNTLYQGKTYNYNYFLDLATSRVTLNVLPAVASQSDIDSGTVSPDGYYYYQKANGTLNLNTPLTISGNKKVIIFAGADTNIKGNVTIANSGQGFFMLISKQQINITPTVTTLEGMYETDGNFNTGSSGTALTVNGTVVTYGNVNMQRDLGSSNTSFPAEKFIFDPTLALLFPRSLIRDSVSWQEVLP